MTQKEPCNECSKSVPIKLKTRKHPGGIEENYIRCPHCKTEFISHVTDQWARKEQQEIKRLNEEYWNRRNKLSFRLAALKNNIEKQKASE